MCVFIIMSKGADTNTSTSWSTWEELLLAFAVKRHGLKDWDAVAMELQNRHRTISTLFTAQICKDRYRYLRQRFTNHHHRYDAAGTGGGVGITVDNELSPSAVNSDAEDNNDDDDDSESSSLPWLEELRKLRVAELKREVQRYDLSIESLQMKVKTMEEEREKSSSENQNGDLKPPDLDEEQEQEERSENDKKGGDSPDEETAGKSVSAEDENRSFNESNSTENRTKTEPEPEREPVVVKPGKSDSLKQPVGGEEDSCNDSSDRHEVRKKASRKRETDSDELRDSVSDSKEGTTKESSDVQSSASLMTSKRRRKGKLDGGRDGGDGGAVVSPANVVPIIKRESSGVVAAVKSEPLVGFLEIIRSHKHGLVFERRLESQKTDKYKNMIRQHVDLETVQARIDNGSYSTCFRRFYVDLLLLFNNAIVFYLKSSPESLAAYELRQIVMKALKNNSAVEPSPESLTTRVQPKPDSEKSDSLLAQHKSTVPVIVCRKRSSIQAKASSSVNKSPLTTSNEEESSLKLKAKEKPVTGVRSMRRNSKGRPNPSNSQSAPSNQNPSFSSQQAGTMDNKGQAAKVDKKKTEEAAIIKKRGAADFLKRIIKKNDLSKERLVEAPKSSGENLKGGKKDQPGKKTDEGKDAQAKRSGGSGGKHAKEEISPSKRNVGRPPKKGKEVAAPVGKRGRESGEGEGSSKRSKKRSRK